MEDTFAMFCDDADDAARFGLLGLMSGLSEELWAASWITGNEFSLWSIVQGRDNRRMGMGEVTERQVQLLKLLSDECNGWWVFDAEKGPRFVNLTEWSWRLEALGVPPPAAVDQ